MIATLWNPQTLATVTLTESQWSAIRTAVLCFAVDERCKGNHDDADHYLSTFKALKEAMGD